MKKVKFLLPKTATKVEEVKSFNDANKVSFPLNQKLGNDSVGEVVVQGSFGVAMDIMAKSDLTGAGIIADYLQLAIQKSTPIEFDSEVIGNIDVEYINMKGAESYAVGLVHNMVGRANPKSLAIAGKAFQSVFRGYSELTIDASKNFYNVNIENAKLYQSIQMASRKEAKIEINWDNKTVVSRIFEGETKAFKTKAGDALFVQDPYNRIKNETMALNRAFVVSSLCKDISLPQEEISAIFNMVESSQEFLKLAGVVSRFAEEFLTQATAKQAELEYYKEHSGTSEAFMEASAQIKEQYRPAMEAITSAVRYELRDVDPVTRVRICLYVAMSGTKDKEHLSAFVHSLLKEEFLLWAIEVDVPGYKSYPYIERAEEFEGSEPFVTEEGITVYRQHLKDAIVVPEVGERQLVVSSNSFFKKEQAETLLNQISGKRIELIGYQSMGLRDAIVLDDACVGKFRCGPGQNFSKRKNPKHFTTFSKGVNEVFTPNGNFVSGVVDYGMVTSFKQKDGMERYSVLICLKEVSETPKHKVSLGAAAPKMTLDSDKVKELLGL